MTAWKISFGLIGSIIIVYRFDNNKLQNITWKYYLGQQLDKFKSGTFYAKIYNSNGANYIAFNGDLKKLKEINFTGIGYMDNLPKRKNVLLLENDTPIEINLEILDNYKMNTSHFGELSVNSLKNILTFIGLKCTHVKIIQTVPFSQQVLPIDEVDINHLYH